MKIWTFCPKSKQILQNPTNDSASRVVLYSKVRLDVYVYLWVKLFGSSVFRKKVAKICCLGGVLTIFLETKNIIGYLGG